MNCVPKNIFFMRSESYKGLTSVKILAPDEMMLYFKMLCYFCIMYYIMYYFIKPPDPKSRDQVQF